MDNKLILRCYSKIVAVMTLILIFAGAQVKSHEAGLAVPDWPTTYGRNMFLFPVSSWVGNIFYEHSHRLIASGVGLMTLVLAVWLHFAEKRRWVKVLGYTALCAVIAQGLLGGLTVLLLLPPAVSILHGVLAQTFLILTIIIAYSQSKELDERKLIGISGTTKKFFRFTTFVVATIYLQLILGALMRHTGSGLAVPDFPTMGGSLVPSVSDAVLANINDQRFELGLGNVSPRQVIIHLVHRAGAIVVTVAVLSLLLMTFIRYRNDPALIGLGHMLAVGVIIQFLFGVLTVFSARAPAIASVHVVTGALLLMLGVILCLRSYPLKYGVEV